MKIIAMIPARLGSKRIPKKNIRYMGDRPLIQYAIDLAKECSEFNEIYVNSESQALGHIVEKMGVKFYKRPMEYASDQVTNREFTYDFLLQHDCDYVVMLNTTSPLLRIDTLERFISFIKSNDYDTVLSVITEREETFFRDRPLNFSLEKKVNSQMLQPTEKICWAITAWKRSHFIAVQENGGNPVFAGKLGRFEIPKDEACDLDTLEDWNIAEGILNARIRVFKERYLEI